MSNSRNRRIGSLSGLFVMLVLLSPLAGCGAKMALDDNVRPRELITEKRGLVLLALDVEGGPCTAGAIHLAIAGPPGKYKKFQHYSLRGAKSNLVQIELPEGTYHVGVIACVQGYRIVNVGTHNGSTLIGDPLKSMGSFSITAGEVVNLGHVMVARLEHGRGDGTVHVVPMNSTLLESLKTQVPRLHTQSKTRLLSVRPGEGFNYSAELLPQGGSRTTYVPVVSYRR